MASKTITDLGSTASNVQMMRDGANFGAAVEVRNNAGSSELVLLTQAEVQTALPLTALPNGTTRRAAALEVYNLLYAAALAKASYV